MAIRVGRRSAFMLLAALFFGLAPTLPTATAAPDAEVGSKPQDSAGAPLPVNAAAKHRSRRATTAAHRELSRQRAKSSGGTEIQTTASLAIEPSLANAKAQLTANAAVGNNATPTSVHGIVKQSSDMRPVWTDQLNEVDRALQPSPGTLALASAEVPALRLAPVTASGPESSTWDRTSLIGRAFIGLGVLLTLASAVRMFMA